jgi:hypothetical protein
MARFWLGRRTLYAADLDYINKPVGTLRVTVTNLKTKNLLESTILVIVIISSVVFGDEVFNTIEQSNDASNASCLSQMIIHFPAG